MNNSLPHAASIYCHSVDRGPVLYSHIVFLVAERKAFLGPFYDLGLDD